MAGDPNRLMTETAHILFMDIVGYSRLSMEEQARLVGELQEVVRGTPKFQRAQGRQELVVRDMGDGLALIFFRDPVAPVQCATEIARAARSRPHLLLRMGVHTGPVSRTTDINDTANVSGAGINLAE